MSHIEVVERKFEPNGSVDYDVAIDGIALPELLDERTKESTDKRLKTIIKPFDNLFPAWSFDLDRDGDVRFVWKVLSMENAPVPILMSEDDTDFSSIVIVAEVEKTKDYVYWNRIGYVNHDKESFNEEKRSGILFTETYSDDDWEKYGDNIALEELDSEKWCKWISENWEEELYRRRMNYTLPYYRAEGSITWFLETDWEFERSEYEAMLDKYLLLQRIKKAEKYLSDIDKKIGGVECANLLSKILPDGKRILENHYTDYGELLLHVFVCEAINEPFIELVTSKTANELELKLYKDAIRIMLLRGEEDVLNALYVSVYERLCDEKDAFEKNGINIDMLIPEN